MNSVELYYICYQSKDELDNIKQQVINQWLAELPLNKNSAIQRLLNYSDQVTSLLAVRLLKSCVLDFGIRDFRLDEIDYPENGKPVWKSKNNFIDFNVSHSDKIIAVAVSQTMHVGLDLEKIKPLKNLNFKMVLSTNELHQVKETPNLFFDFWSKKEAVVKAANTIGLARMRDVILDNESAVLDNQKWFLKKIELDKQYVSYVAASDAIDAINTKQISIKDLCS